MNTLVSLHEIIQDVSTLDLEKCLANIVHNAITLIDAPFAAVFIKQGGVLKLKSWVGAHVSPCNLFLTTPGNIVKEVISQNKVILLQDVSKVDKILPLVPASRSVLAVPLKINDTIIGVLLIESPRANAFSQGDRDQVVRFASLAAIAISNADLFRKLEEKNREILLINEMSSALQKCNNIREALEVAVKYGAKLFPLADGIFFVPRKDSHTKEELVSWGNLSEKKAIKIISLSNNKFSNPLIARNENLGMLYLNKKNGSGVPDQLLDDSSRGLVTTFTDQISLALDNLKLRETLTYQALRDSLTGLYNRRFMEEFLERELSRAKRKNKTIVLMMLDIDYFKEVNDTYGHKAGDKVLIELSKILRSYIRKGDIACRYGGEEFLIILPDIDISVAYKRAEKIRRAIKNRSIKFEGKHLDPITVSLGLVAYPTHGKTSHKLLMEADKFLYQAKMAGRDRISLGCLDECLSYT
ncbi:MAG: diguanylate cyclase [Bacillota bacterium]|jgi:diguanylate cyclase (GGDEF)-like protein